MDLLFLPLDERPCNYRFPCLMPDAGVRLNLPPMEMMGLKKRPADRSAIARWLKENAGAADAAILSLDTLIYGGLIPSRLHKETREELFSRADLVRELRAAHPNLKLYAYLTVMRCPFYSLSEEEPDYYADYGAEIHLCGKYTDKEALGLLTEEEKGDFARVRRKIPEEALKDYVGRRKRNLEVLFHVLDMVEEGVFDGFVIPQDDSAPYGYTSIDRRQVTAVLREKGLQLKVPVYPAADDVGLTMLARAVNEFHGIRPNVFVYYASAQGAFVTPCFEDRTIDATVKNQILASGCRRVYSLPECDIALAVNIGSEMLYLPNEERRVIPYGIERSLPEYIDFLKYALAKGKVVAVADVADPTNSDLELLRLLRDEDLLLKIHAYAGWNTSSNTLGTVLSESCLYFLGKDERGNRAFLLHRYYDDVGYCSHTRYFVDTVPVPKYGCTVFVLDGERGKCVEEGKRELLRYMQETFPSLARYVEDVDLSSPWNRTFEMDLILKLKDLP